MHQGFSLIFLKEILLHFFIKSIIWEHFGLLGCHMDFLKDCFKDYATIALANFLMDFFKEFLKEILLDFFIKSIIWEHFWLSACCGPFRRTKRADGGRNGRRDAMERHPCMHAIHACMPLMHASMHACMPFMHACQSCMHPCMHSCHPCMHAIRVRIQACKRAIHACVHACMHAIH